MQYLLDTHTLLWFLEDDPRLPQKVRKEIVNIDNNCFLSIASLWEIAIKIKVKKLMIEFTFEKFEGYLSAKAIELIPISFEHLNELLNLELYHRDPFDRMIIAQSITEDFTILSSDKHFKSYAVKLLWK